MKANLFQRSLTTIFSVLIISIGIVWMQFSNFGTDPFMTINIGISQILSAYLDPHLNDLQIANKVAIKSSEFNYLNRYCD